MDKFIKENTEKKAILLGFKKLKKKISKEIVRHSREFEGYSKGILIVGENYARLMIELIERNLDEGAELDVSKINFIDRSKSELSIWGMPIYVTQEDDVIMLINSLGERCEDNFGINFCTEPLEKGSFNISTKEPNALIDELPDSSKFRRVLQEEMV